MRKLLLSLLFCMLCAYATKAQNYAFNFTNRTDIVAIGGTSIAPPWTAEMWVYKKATTPYSTAIDGTSSKLTFEGWNLGQKVGFTKKGSADWAFPAGYILPLSTWTHLAWVCNGTKTFLYVNGIVKDSLAQVIDLPMSSIGQSAESPNAYMDEIRLWKGAKNGTELLAGMNTSANPKDPTLLGYWFCDDQASPATDISIAGRSCAITGTKYVANTIPFTTVLANQTITGSNCEQFNGLYVKANTTNQDILLINVQVSGVASPKQVTSISVGTLGTTSLADVSNVKIFYTGNSKVFATTKAFGSSQPVASELTFAGTQNLNSGNNYFWVTYDVPTTATTGNKLDAVCTSIVVSGEAAMTPAAGNPTGNRTIQNTAPAPAKVISLIPKPVSMTQNSGSFTLTATTKICVDAASTAEGILLSDMLKKSTGYTFEVTTGGDKTNNISLETLPTKNKTIGDEGFILDITSTGITVKANSSAGIYYGTQTIRQLLPKEINSATVVSNVNWTCPNVSIVDYPRFAWRGFMLDVSRHFFSVAQVKKYIDIMAMNKMNVFHWHLMDDQGFRIEIKSHPELTTIGSVRSLCPSENTRYDQGYYTQNEIKDVVAYALARHVNIEPEIETPGHAAEWLASLPGLACTSVVPGTAHVTCMNSGNSSVNTVNPKTICMGKAYTYQIMSDVINEVTALFPFKYVHIGGDEAVHDPWTTCTDCQKMMRDSTSVALPMDNSHLHNVQTFYLRRIQRMLEANGKKVVGWSEMGQLNSRSVLQDWIGGSDAAINNGNETIYSNGYSFYLDSYQGGTNEPQAMTWMGTITMDKVYNYNPPTASMSDAKRALALGIETCLWNEYGHDTIIVEYRLLPRLYAAAEASWTPENGKNYNDFMMRLYYKIGELNIMKYNYCPLSAPAATAPEATINGECSGTVKLSAGFGSDYYYWNNDTNSTSSEITVNKSGTYKVYGAIGSQTIQRVFNVTIPQPPTELTISNTTNGVNTIYKGTNSNYAYRWYDAAVAGNLLETADTCLAPTSSPRFVSAALRLPQVGLTFNGTNYVSAPALNKSMNNVTFEAWIQTTAVQNDIAGIIFNRGTSAYGLNIRANGQLMYHWKDANWAWNSNLTVPQNKWVHVALVIRPNSATIFLNGDSATNVAPHAAEAFTDAIKLGYDQGSRYFKGVMDEVRIWGVAKTKAEILANMNVQLSGNEANLLAYYKMNESIGANTKDEVTAKMAILNSFTEADWNTSNAAPVKNSMCESERWDVKALSNAVIAPKKDAQCTIYPNPSRGNFTAVITGSNVSSVKWFDIVGKTLNFEPTSKNDASNELKLEFKSIPKGIYMISIFKKNEAVETIKVVVN